MEKLVCNKCGKEFLPGNRHDGIPNGMGFVLADGSTITVCAECIIKMGEQKMQRNEK